MLKNIFKNLKKICPTKHIYTKKETKSLYFKAYKKAWDVIMTSKILIDKQMNSDELGKDLDEFIEDYWKNDSKNI